ncbi:Cullin-domain-containing protein [Venturia nashicola]|uniref:Cullin-domain-containing protein n=1 Tax=Venturia nashicola TaxID=86259 RepID=A0A4Z1P0Q3_9PEZI|nr:Cullin-domain-containing protein [Venturia nashicola]TLD35143.1 Cullin-domain-containing protein [Venturia nashicola]
MGSRKKQGLNADDIDFETSWSSLSSSLTQIHTGTASNLSYEQLYRFAYRIVLKKKGDQLYNKVKEFEQDWLKNNVCTVIQSLLTTSLLTSPQAGTCGASGSERRVAGEAFLSGVRKAWHDHQICMNMVADVLMYLDRVYCSDNRQPPIFTSSMELFRDNILYASTLSQDESLKTVILILVDVVLEQVQMERNEEVINKSIIKNCIGMLEGLYMDKSDNEEMRLYVKVFEPEFLEASRKFYQQEGETQMVHCDAGAYSRLVDRRIREEVERCRSTLSETTTTKIEKIVEEELIKNRIQSIIDMDTGVTFMIDNDHIEELGLIFDLNARVDPKKTELTKAIAVRVVDMGNEINKAVAVAAQPISGQAGGNSMTVAAIKWVEDVLLLKDKFDTIWKNAFKQDPTLQTTLTRSFADFINSTTFQRGSEYISLFIDDNMKKGIKDKTEAQVDEVLDKAITLLRYVQDKDLFERYYKKHLSRRLLMNKSISIDVEKQMISRMKIELGNNFTTKLEAMFKDMTISAELTQGYKEHVASLGATDTSRVDLKVDILTSMTWPLDGVNTGEDEQGAKPKVAYPPAIDRVKQGFEHYYAEKHNGRVLTWYPNMGTADITVRFPAKEEGKPRRQHDLNVPTYGMIILMLFQDLPTDQGLGFVEIQAITNIPASDLRRNLQALAVAKEKRILKKVPMGREVNDDDIFFFNESFESKFRRVKIGVIAANNRAETEKERRETEKKMDEQRGFIVEAAIVRIMKQRKTCTHENLLLETVTQVSSRFKPDVPMIKTRINSLMEREYIERIEDSSPSAYRYLA